MKTKISRFSALPIMGALFAFSVAQTARAGGIDLYEIATPDLGLASAGYASRADDASTVFKNPAGMSRLDCLQVQVGLQAMYGSVYFSHNANTSPRLGTDNGENAIDWLPGAGLFITAPLGDRFHIGLGALSYFGLSEDYGNNWVGRYYVQRSTLVGLSLMPSVSFKVTDWLSIGAGLNAMNGYLDTHVAVNNLTASDGQMKLKDDTWGFGANAGVLIQAGANTRFGLTYLSRVNLDFKDTPSFTGLGPLLSQLPINPPELNLGLTVPQSAMASAYHALNDCWALMADFGWQDWHQFGEVEVGVESGGVVTRNLNLKDTWHGALGAQFHASDKWLFSGGVAFDSSAVDSADRSVLLPVGQTWRFGLGAQYQLSRTVNVGLAETFMWIGDMSVDQGSDLSLRGRVAGAYDTTWFSVTSISLTCKF
jgi:long-chain fatty acid transport protein